MICTKCNSEVPSGAKFCPVCGTACGIAPDVRPAAAPPEPEKKNYCAKCGLELRQGAKFCAVCGAPAAGVGDIRPAQNSGAVFGNGAMSAVSLDKPRESDGLVAAMSSAPAPSAFVPSPSNDIGSGFGGSGYSSDPIPAFIPESPVNAPIGNVNNAPFGGADSNPFGDMGAAAVVATPIKKKTGAKVGIIIAAVVAVLIAAAAIFFFTNKATALSLIMGKPNYAAMVEGNSIKSVTEKLDLPAVSNGIKSASNVISAMAAVSNEYDGAVSGVSNTASAKVTTSDMMSITSPDGSTMSSYSEDDAVDIEAIINMYNELMMSTYGVNSVNASLDMDIELADSIKDLLGEGADDILKLLNDTTFTTSVSSASDKLAAAMSAENGSSVIDVKTVFTKDGEIYIVLPFVSDQGLKVKIPTTTGTVRNEEIKPLELDEKEIERLIGEMVEIYLAEYKESAIEMENGELSAAGLTATGKLITAQFSGEDLSALISKLTEHFVNDEYFTTKIVDFANECGAEITAEEYKQSVIDEMQFDATDSDKLTISTIIDNNGNVLAKSFTAESENGNATLTYVDSPEQFTLEALQDGMTVIALVQDITSEQEGVVTVKCTDGDAGSFTMKLTYADVNTAKLCDNDVLTGKYTFGIELPADFTEDISEEIGTLSNITFTYSNAVDSANTMESSFGIKAGSLGSISLNTTMTVQNDDAALAIPSDVIDLGDMETQPDDATIKKLEDYIKTAGEKISALENGPFGDLLRESGILDGIEMLGESSSMVGTDEIVDLITDINEEMSEITECRAKYGSNDPSLEGRANMLIGNLNTLLTEINEKVSGGMTPEELAAFTSRYNTLSAQIDALVRDYEAKAQSPSSTTTPSSSNTPSSSTTPSTQPDLSVSGGTTAESLDYDKMSDEELAAILTEYDDRYITLAYNDEIYARVMSDPALTALYNECESAYEDAYDDFEQLIDSYSDGVYNIGILRNLRKSTKTYAVAVEKFEKAVQSQA